MDRLLFVLALILATAASTVTGADINAYCDDPIFCKEKPRVYDSHTENMKKLFQQNKKLIKLTNTTNEDTEIIPETPQGDDQNCWSITTLEKPFAIKSLNTSTSHLVVQLDGENFVQKFKYTRCLYSTEDTPCLSKVFNVNNVARCKEKMAGVSLYIYDPAKNEMGYQMFEIPVACACKFPH